MVMFYTTFCFVVSVDRPIYISGETEIFDHVKRANLKHTRKETPIATLSSVEIGGHPKTMF